MQTKDISIKYVNIEDLKPAEYNPRQASELEYNNLRKSLLNYGIVDPIIVNSAPNRMNTVIGGHFRLRVAKDIGYKNMPVVYVNIPDEAKERELNLRLNKNLGEWDFDLLANFDEELLKDVGFTSEELDKIFQIETEKDPDELPPEGEVRVKAGELYKLGAHRLLCGDSTKKEDVEKLMDGQKCNIVVTSPPYWNQREYSHWEKFDDYINDMFLVASNLPLETNAIVFWNIGDDSPNHRHISAHHSLMLERANLIYIDAIVWKKQGVTGIRLAHQKTHKKYYPGFCFELCLVFQKDNTMFPCFDGSVSTHLPITNVWEINTATNIDKKHSAPFPIELAEKALMAYSNKDLNVCYEPFGGSGSTLIACERLNRKCYMMEIDPKYCQVIIDRWEKYTNQTASKL